MAPGKSFREVVLHSLKRAFPADIAGDLHDFSPADNAIRVSCIVNFYGRLDLLSGILHSLAHQDLPADQFEVVLVEDQGGTEAGRDFCMSFAEHLQIRYHPLDKNFGRMGYSRNFGLARARGQYVLFLDDDTVLLQQNFLSRLLGTFGDFPWVDALIPRGRASFALPEDHYDYHAPYFMTSRCMAYPRAVLEELGGFMENFVGQEDVEFVVRFHLASKKSLPTAAVEYFHPPLLAPNLKKAKAVGASFYKVKERYPFLLWMLLIVNCSRHVPLYLFPVRRYREMGRFGWGFLLGVWEACKGKKDFQYS